MNEEDGAVAASNSTGNMALSTSKSAKTTKRKKMTKVVKDTETIEENDNYSFFREGDFNIFEIKDAQAAQAYHTGLKRNNPTYWRENETTNYMLGTLRDHKNRNFVVRTHMGDSMPLRHNGI